jgi:hypothetical protein
MHHLFLRLALEGVEVNFIDREMGCAYMHLCSKRGRTLSGISSLKKTEEMTHEEGVVSQSAHPSETYKSWQ